MFTSWFKKKKKSSDPQNGQTLPDFVRGIQHAVNTAHQIAGQQQIENLNFYFDDDGNPEMRRLKMPSGHVMDVPLFTLVPQSNLELKNVKIKMSVKINSATKKEHKYDENSEPTHRTSFGVSLTSQNGNKGSTSSIDIEMEFKSGDPPEATAKIMEEFLRGLLPKDDDGSSPGEAVSEPGPALEPEPQPAPEEE